MSHATPTLVWLWRAAAGLALVNGLAFLFLVQPAREIGRRQEDQILELQRQIRQVQRDSQASQTALVAQHEVEEFGRGYPRRAELVGLVGRLAQAARAHGLEIPAVDYRPSEVKEADLTRVAVSLGLEGSYLKIRRFLYDLEGMRRHLVIERVTLRDPRGTAELQLQLHLSLYLR